MRLRWFASVLGFLLICFPLTADPPVLPQTAPPEIPCNPLVCFQITDVEETAPDNFRLEFEVLNWTAFTDRACPPTDPTCIDRTSAGSEATGLVFVRSGALSSIPMRFAPVDPNGAPLGTDTQVDRERAGVLPGGDPGVELSKRFVDTVESVFNEDQGATLSPSCYELADALEGLLLLSEDGDCDDEWDPNDRLEIDYAYHRGSQTAAPNSWLPGSCTDDQVTWLRDPSAPDPLVLEQEDTNVKPSCPTSCAQKDSLGNVLDGFVIELEDFAPGDRLVFNWYLLNEDGPIASGGVPTATDRGSLGPSPLDPWGFSYGSFQIDRKESCAGGGCDTMIVVDPPVTNPATSCIVDEKLNRNQLPFDLYVSLGPAGEDPPCRIEPALAQDDKGLERLVVRATVGDLTDLVTVQFRNLQTEVIEKSVKLPLTSGSVDIPTDDLLGRYEVTGICENTVSSEYFFLNTFEMAVPKRGDLPDTGPNETLALELDAVTGGYAVTGAIPPGSLDLDDVTDACHFIQVRDSSGRVRILGTEGGPEILTRHGDRHVLDERAPTVSCEPDILLGTSSDGGFDCRVEVDVMAVASDEAGGFTLTNDLGPGEVRSFGTALDGREVAVQTATGVFTIGPASPVTFTVADDAEAAAQCATLVEIVDDVPPQVECNLVPAGPGQGVSDQNWIVELGAEDDCPGNLEISASIDGVPVAAGQAVKITHARSPGVRASEMGGGRLHIVTSQGGILEVTARDAAGNVGTCATTACAQAFASGGGTGPDGPDEKGNNGVGNGEEPQPPGNPPVNDGPGTGPGNPGNRG